MPKSCLRRIPREATPRAELDPRKCWGCRLVSGEIFEGLGMYDQAYVNVSSSGHTVPLYEVAATRSGSATWISVPIRAKCHEVRPWIQNGGLFAELESDFTGIRLIPEWVVTSIFGHGLLHKMTNSRRLQLTFTFAERLDLAQKFDSYCGDTLLK